jgi:hypothetical protein
MQLELLPVPVPIVARSSKTPEQEAAFQALLAECQREAAELEAIGHQLYPDEFVGMRKCPIDQYKAVCAVWHKSNGRQLVETIDRVPPLKKKKPPIRQWSLVAKQRSRLVKLHQRLHRQYSFPEMFHQALQEKVLQNPDYYGVCPLPSEGQCAYYPPNLRQIAAIKLENECRARGI